MSTQIFLNIVTDDLDRSKAFYEALGAEINPLFTNDDAAAVVWSDDVYFMVLKREYFATFTDKTVIDPKTSAQVLIAFSRDSKAAVDATMALGLAAGGAEPRETQDLGFMYSRDLEDPDGNILEFFWMDDQAVEDGPAAHLSDEV